MMQLLYYEADTDLANAMRPSWDEHSYRHVDVVAADRVFADIDDAVVNAETRSVAVTQRGVYFAFYDQVRRQPPARRAVAIMARTPFVRFVVDLDEYAAALLYRLVERQIYGKSNKCNFKQYSSDG